MITLHHADALDVLRALPDDSVDAIITDPPYGLADHKPAVVAAALTAWAGGDRARVPDGKGFMGRAWDAFVPPPALWDEALRVLKPGGHLAAFAGARTYDLMGLSIRLAGFEVRDGLQWLYGSGMPKGLDVGKAIDKAAGAPREVIGYGPAHDGALGQMNDDAWTARTGPTPITAPATADAARWQGWNTSLKPAHEPIVLARKPLTGTVAANVLAHGVGAINIDATRTAHASPADLAESIGKNQHTRYANPGSNADSYSGSMPARVDYDGAAGRWPTNVLLDEHAAAWLDDQTADMRATKPAGSGPGGVRPNSIYGGGAGLPPRHDAIQRDDEGGASRFFPTFHYSPKAPKTERPLAWGAHASCHCAGPAARPLDPDTGALPPQWRAGTVCGSCGRPAALRGHNTVKPVAVMAWLVRLLVPPGGRLVDPFAGSGTTGQAAAGVGVDAVLIERDEHSVRLCEARLDLNRTPAPAASAPPAPVVVDLPVVELAASAPPAAPVADPVLAAIALTDEAGCGRLYDALADVWTDTHTDAVRARLSQLTERAA